MKTLNHNILNINMHLVVKSNCRLNIKMKFKVEAMQEFSKTPHMLWKESQEDPLSTGFYNPLYEHFVRILIMTTILTSFLTLQLRKFGKEIQRRKSHPHLENEKSKKIFILIFYKIGG